MYQPAELCGLKPVRVATFPGAAGAGGVEKAMITFDDGSIWLWSFEYHSIPDPGGGPQDAYGKWTRIFQPVTVVVGKEQAACSPVHEFWAIISGGVHGCAALEALDYTSDSNRCALLMFREKSHAVQAVTDQQSQYDLVGPLYVVPVSELDSAGNYTGDVLELDDLSVYKPEDF
jgi:hypothetical protein